MDKWGYIREISKLSNKQGNLLIDLMDRYKANNLTQITYEQAKKFYEEFNGKLAEIIHNEQSVANE